MFLIRMRETSPMFVSTSYLGELVSYEGSKVRLKSVCAVFEILGKAKDGGTLINASYATNSALSNGILTFDDGDILFSREVEDSDELLQGYHSSFEAFRLEKLNIQKMSSIPNNASNMERN